MTFTRQQQLFVYMILLSALVNTLANKCEDPNGCSSEDHVSLLQTKIATSGSIGKDSNNHEIATKDSVAEVVSQKLHGGTRENHCCFNRGLTRFKKKYAYWCDIWAGYTVEMKVYCCDPWGGSFKGSFASTSSTLLKDKAYQDRERYCTSWSEKAKRIEIKAAMNMAVKDPTNKCTAFFTAKFGIKQEWLTKWQRLDKVFQWVWHSHQF